MFLNFKSFFVAGLRGFTLLAKLVFTIILARLLNVEEFGQWVLIVAIVTYGIFIVGAEIYNITLRTYIAEGHAAVLHKFSAQWSYFGGIYAIIVLGGLLLSQAGGRALYSNALLISLLLVLEHLTQELHRLAFFRDHQVHANVILLIKTAGWMVPTGIYLALVPAHAHLAIVLKAWLIGALLSAAYALATYRGVFRGLRPQYLRHFAGRHGHVFRVLTPFLILAVAVRTPLILDRYFIEHFVGSAQLGAYGYYATFGNGVQAIFDAVILARLIPRLLSGEHSRAEFIPTIFSFMRQSLVFWLVSLAGLYVAIPYVNGFVGKESFQDAFGLLLLLAGGQMIFSLAAIAQYGLYAQRRDGQLTTGALLYMGLSLIGYIALIPTFGSYGAASALAIAASALLALRMWQLLRHEPVPSTGA